MHCCGHAGASGMDVEHAAHHASAMFAGCAGTRSDAPAAAAEPYAAARRLLREHVSIDVHTHAGPNGVTSRTARPSDDLARGMRAGGIAVLCLADVPDGPILGRDAGNVLRALREPEPGFLYQYHQERLDWLDTLTAKHGIRRVLTVADLEAAHKAGAPAIILDIEGLDFLERKLERLEESYRRGVRTMQLVHYTPNDIGDFQTGPSRTAASPRSGPTSSARATGSASSWTWRTRPRTPSSRPRRSGASRCSSRTPRCAAPGPRARRRSWSGRSRRSTPGPSPARAAPSGSGTSSRRPSSTWTG